MPRVKEIKIEITDSVKLGEYQYVKPTMGFTLQLNKGDKLESYLVEAKERLLNEMDKLKKDIVSNHRKGAYK